MNDETRRIQAIEGRDALREAAIALLQQARQSLCIASHALDPALFRNMELLDALKDQLLAQRRLKVRILISEPRKARPHADGLLGLALRLGSQFTFHEPTGPEFAFNHDSWVADRSGHLRRNQADALIAAYGSDDPMGAHNLKDEFETAWLHSRPSLEFRQLA